MQIVVSQAWLLPGEEHVEAYVATSRAFEDFYRAQPGYITRYLARGVEDPTHIIHLRVWESTAHYEAMTQIPEYQAHIESLSHHVDAERYTEGYPREYADILFASDAG